MQDETDSKIHSSTEDEGHLWRGFGTSVRLTPLPGIGRVRKIALGQNHAVILTESGQVFATGNNSHGQLGNGKTSDHVDTPFKIASLTEKCRDVACGTRHSGAVDVHGRLFMWGSNENQQCAVEDSQFVVEPTLVEFPRENDECVHGRRYARRAPRVLRLSCGESHSVALTTNRELWTWGHGLAMGLVNVTRSSKPTRIDFLRGRHVVSVACGGYHTVALISTMPLEELGDEMDNGKSCPWCDSSSQINSDDGDREVCPFGLVIKNSPNEETPSEEIKDSKATEEKSNEEVNMDGDAVRAPIKDAEAMENKPKPERTNNNNNSSSSSNSNSNNNNNNNENSIEQVVLRNKREETRPRGDQIPIETEIEKENDEKCEKATNVGDQRNSEEAANLQKRKSSPSYIDTQSAKEFLARRLSSIASAMSPSSLTNNSNSKESVFVYETATDAIRQNVSVITNMVMSGVKNTVDKFGFVSKQFSRDYDSALATSLDGEGSSTGTDFDMMDDATSTQHPYLLHLAYTCRMGIESRARSLKSEAKKKLSRSSRCGSLDTSLHSAELDVELLSTCVLKERQIKDRSLLTTEVWSWGRGNMGQLGQGDGLDRPQPCCINILRNKGIIQVDAGLCHTVALTAGGQVFVWGYNSHGQLGNPNRTMPGYSPQLIALDSCAIVWDVAAGNKHSVLLADRGLHAEIYYCGKQEGPLPGMEVGGPVPLSGAIGTTNPVEISIASSGSIVRRVFAGGFLCGCISDDYLPPNVITIRELSSSERCFHQTITLFKDAVLDPLCKDGSYSTIVSSSFGPAVESVISCFRHLWHQVALNNLMLGRVIRLPPSRCSVSSLIDHLESWVTSFEKFASAYLDLYACNGLAFCAKTASSFLCKTQPFKQEDKSTAEVLSRLLEEPFRRMSEYQRSFEILAEQCKQVSVSNFRELEVAKTWSHLCGAFQREKESAEKTRLFWDSCPQKIAESIRASNRRLLRDSKTNSLILSGSGRFSSNWFILFNDVFVHAQFSNCFVYPLPLIWVDTLCDSEASQETFTFTVMMPEESLSLQCPTSQEKTEWMRALNGAIRAILAKPKSICRGLGSATKFADERLSPALNRTATYKFTKKTQFQDATYAGTWLCAKMHGQGELTWPDGRKFTGKFKQNVQCGDGLYIIPSEEGNKILEGVWKDGKMNGLGSVRYPNKDLYEGYFKDDECHGHGVFKKGQFMSSAASMYIGEWAHGQRNGYGVNDDIVSGEKYMGLWQDDSRHGSGMVVSLDGVYYEGNFAQNKMSGHGLMIFEDDSWYEGEFGAAGGFGGKGTMTFASGDQIEGTFTGTWTEAIKINGTIHKAQAHSSQADKNKPNTFGTLCVPADKKWTDIFHHCYDLLGISDDFSPDADLSQRVWETVAAVISKWRERLSRHSTRSYPGVQELDGLDRIPQIQKGEKLTLERYREFQSYLSRAFGCPYHPLGKMMEGLVDVYRSAYVGVGAHPRLLSHAVAEVHSFIARVYRIVRVLFPSLPREEMKVKSQITSAPTDSNVERPEEGGDGDDEDDDDEEEGLDNSDVVTPSSLILPILLPQIYPPLFTLYALHNEKDDVKYWDALLKWNRQSDLSLMTFLGVDPKFWFTENEDGRKNISSIKDEHFSKAVDTLQHLSTTFSPTEKLRVIHKTFQEITKEVQSCLGEDFVWTMDDLFPVFQYVVVRARIRHLGSEVLMIDDLMESHLQHGELGIMFTTLKACYFQVKKEQSMYS